MAKVTLSDDETIEVNKPLEHGKGISEILFFPKVPMDLDSDPDEEGVQQVWALEGKRLELFIAETKKYDDAATNLAEAQEKLAGASEKSEIESAEKEVVAAQEAMRQTLLKGYGKKDDKNLTPVPQGSGKKLIECIGFINKRTFYISTHDLKKVKDERGRKTFRFDTNTFESIEKNLVVKLEAELTDSDKGKADEKLKKKFRSEFQNKINAEWKFGEAKTEGQLKSKKIAKYVPNLLIREFLTNTEAGKKSCDFVDRGVKFFNETANFSYKQKEQKLSEIVTLLEFKDDKFSHYHWGLVLLGIQVIWNKTDYKFVSDIRKDYIEIPLKEKARKVLIDRLYKQGLPKVMFDASGGAQFMRYSANCGGSALVDFEKGKVSVSYGAKAKLSLFEAGVESNLYFPNNNGLKLEFKVPVFKEAYESEVISDGDNGDSNPMFAHNSSFMLPSALIDTAYQVQGLAFTKKNAVNNELLIQVSGYTDTSGSDKYNKNLGYRRAQSLQALFTNNTAQWQEYFDRGIWNDKERNMMKLCQFMMKEHPQVFRDRYGNMLLGDTEKLDDVLDRELKIAVDKYDFPVEELDGYTLIDNPKANKINIPKVGQTKDQQLIQDYQSNMREYLIQEVPGVSESDFGLFHINSELISFGEDNLNVKQEGKIAANRRVCLTAIGVTKKDPEETDDTINLGKGRLHIQGQLSCFVGANVGLSGALELNTHMGRAQLVAKKEKDDKVAIYDKDGKITPSEDLANATASVDAFAGASAEAAISAALEWDNPNNNLKWEVLASIGGSVTGTAGAGISGEFKIGFDQRTKTFQVKIKAQATWGIGGGGAWSLTIGVQQLFDFVILVITKLREKDFNFLDIFENETDENNKPTESDINVFEVYESWILGLLKEKEYFKAGAAILVGASALVAFEILSDFNRLVDKYKQYTENKDETENIVNNILANPDMLQYVPPRVKGRMLYMMTQYKSRGWTDIISWDDFKEPENAAVLLLESIKHAREWKEVMEHMAVKTNDGKDFENYDKSKAHYQFAGDITRAGHSIIFLRNELLNEYEKWKKVQDHIAGIDNWDKAWNEHIK